MSKGCDLPFCLNNPFILPLFWIMVSLACASSAGMSMPMESVEHISFHAVGVLFGAVEGASVSRQVECHVQTLLPNVYCSGPIAVYHLIVSLLSKCKNYKEQYGEKKEYYVFEHNLLIFRIYNFSFLIIYLFHRILERLDVGSRNGQEVVHAEHTYAVAVAVAGHLSHIVYVYEEGAMYVYDEIVSF